MACSSVSEHRCKVVGKSSGSSCCLIPFLESIVLVSSGATGLPLFDGVHSVGVPCCCKEVGEGVWCGDGGDTESPRSQDSSRLAVSKRGSTREWLDSVTA